MKKYIVYKITSTITNKSYIGYTGTKFKTRWNAHLKESRKINDKKYHFHNAIKKYGKENWIKEILFETNNKEEALQKEIELIKKYDTFNNGYNMTLGGEAGILIQYSGNYWMKNKTEEEIHEIHLKKSCFKENNGFYGKTHTKETINKIIKIKRRNNSYGMLSVPLKVKYDNIIFDSKNDCKKYFKEKYDWGRKVFDRFVREGKVEVINQIKGYKFKNQVYKTKKEIMDKYNLTRNAVNKLSANKKIKEII